MASFPAPGSQGGANIDEVRPQIADAQGSTHTSIGIDEAVREVAAIEPLLKFPARIGIARIEGGRLVQIPQEELIAWDGLAADRRHRLGTFVPIDLFQTELIWAEYGGQIGGPSDTNGFSDAARLQNTVAKIRLGAARQHVDAVLVYEVAGTSDVTDWPLNILDLTLVGHYILPTYHKARGFAAARLIDVRNGYPYGTATHEISDASMRLKYKDRRKKLASRAKTEATLGLMPKVESMFEELAVELAAR